MTDETMTLRLERLLDAPIDTVWRWLIEPELRARWFAGGPTDPREGGAITLVFDHDNLSSEDVPYPPECAAYKGQASHETIVRIDPPRLLAFTWDGGSEGVVTFELFDEAGQTRLVLTHAGITGPAPRASFGGGWTSHLAVLEARLAGRDVADFWAIHRRSEAEFERSGG